MLRLLSMETVRQVYRLRKIQASYTSAVVLREADFQRNSAGLTLISSAYYSNCILFVKYYSISKPG